MTLIEEILETLSSDELGLILRSQSDERFQELMKYFVRDSNTRCKCWYEGIYLLMSRPLLAKGPVLVQNEGRKAWV